MCRRCGAEDLSGWRFHRCADLRGKTSRHGAVAEDEGFIGSLEDDDPVFSAPYFFFFEITPVESNSGPWSTQKCPGRMSCGTHTLTSPLQLPPRPSSARKPSR